MANQQLIKGGAALAVTMTQPGAAAGTGQSYPSAQSNPNANIYNGSTLLWTGLLNSGLPSTQNGITVSAAGFSGPGFASSVTVAATSSAPATTGLTVLTSSGGTTTSGVFDVVATLVAPTGVSATPGAGLGVVINCTNASAQPSGTTYNLLEGTAAGGESQTPVASGITLPYTQQETAAGQKYYILQAASGGSTANSPEVSALAYNQQSGGSNVATGTAQAPPAGAVTSLTATLLDNGTAPSFQLAWALPGSGQPTGFNIRLGTSAGAESTTPLNASPLAATATGYTTPALAYATNYYLVVDSISAGGTVTSAEVHVKTDTSRPSLTVTNGNGVETLNITNGGGTLGVAIYRCLHGGTLALFVTLPNAAASYSDTSAVNGTAYDYQVFDLD